MTEKIAHHVVTRHEIRHFAVAVGAMAPEHHDPDAARSAGYRDLVAPAFFFCTLGLSLGRVAPAAQLREDGLGADDDLAGRVVIGSESVEWDDAIVAGDEVVARQEFLGSRVTTGRAGRLTLFEYRRRYSVTDDPVVTECLVRVGRDGEVARERGAVADSLPARVTRSVRPGEVDLFMFSAATWLTHRIHYDRDHARSEGFPDLVVHGPLQGAYLAELVTAIAREEGGSLAGLNYRHHRPAYCGEELTLEAGTPVRRDDGGSVEVPVRVLNPRGEVVTSGNGVVRLPDTVGAR